MHCFQNWELLLYCTVLSGTCPSWSDRDFSVPSIQQLIIRLATFKSILRTQYIINRLEIAEDCGCDGIELSKRGVCLFTWPTRPWLECRHTLLNWARACVCACGLYRPCTDDVEAGRHSVDVDPPVRRDRLSQSRLGNNNLLSPATDRSVARFSGKRCVELLNERSEVLSVCLSVKRVTVKRVDRPSLHM